MSVMRVNSPVDNQSVAQRESRLPTSTSLARSLDYAEAWRETILHVTAVVDWVICVDLC